MKFTDLLIIYFSAGAPFAVHFFIQNRHKLDLKKLRLNTLFTFCFWIPSALRILSKNDFIQKNFFSSDKKKSSFSSECEGKLHEIQKQLEKVLLENNSSTSIYKMRETFNRYVGLTLAAHAKNSEGGSRDFFRAAKNKNLELAAKCFNRRNRQRLFFHQTLARQDFLQVIAPLFIGCVDVKDFSFLVCEFVEILQDFEAQILLEKMFAEKQPKDKFVSVKVLEKGLWKQEIRKSLPVNSISTFMQTTSKTTNLQKKD